jgi:hypothetical protein
MKNLTQNQELIIEQLVNEFTNINEAQLNLNGNIFSHLRDEIDKDKNRIKEIEVLNRVGMLAFSERIEADFNKYNKMFYDLGIKLKKTYDHREGDWELVTLRKNKDGEAMYVRDRVGYNPLKWCYYTHTSHEYILGGCSEYVTSHYIKCYGEYNVEYKTIEEIFERPLFQEYLKRLINLA